MWGRRGDGVECGGEGGVEDGDGVGSGGQDGGESGGEVGPDMRWLLYVDLGVLKSLCSGANSELPVCLHVG